MRWPLGEISASRTAGDRPNAEAGGGAEEEPVQLVSAVAEVVEHGVELAGLVGEGLGELGGVHQLRAALGDMQGPGATDHAEACPGLPGGVGKCGVAGAQHALAGEIAAGAAGGDDDVGALDQRGERVGIVLAAEVEHAVLGAVGQGCGGGARGGEHLVAAGGGLLDDVASGVAGSSEDDDAGHGVSFRDGGAVRR